MEQATKRGFGASLRVYSNNDGSIECVRHTLEVDFQNVQAGINEICQDVRHLINGWGDRFTSAVIVLNNRDESEWYYAGNRQPRGVSQRELTEAQKAEVEANTKWLDNIWTF